MMRLEALVGLAAALALAAMHLGEIRLARFAALFVAIDAIGYLPGAIAFRRARGARIAPVFHVLYNGAHSFAVMAIVAAAWSLALGPEWALLAIPLHLFGDRALFGNFAKPFAAPFEPRALPAFERFERELASVERREKVRA